MPEDSDQLVTHAVDTTLALIAHRQNETDLLTERSRYIWDLRHEHGMTLAAISERLVAELHARGVTDARINQMGRQGLGISVTKIHEIVSGDRP